MSCTAPLNIVKKSAGRCSLKCLLWYNYTASTCTVKTNTDHLSIIYDGVSDVVFNSIKYTPKEIRLYRPSLHTFDGVHADAELIVTHNSSSGGLMICLPITGNSDINASTASILLSEIIKNAPETDNSITINLQDFNLNYIIPKSPYFSYIGTEPFDGCTSSTMYHYVVFPRQSIYVNNDTLDELANVINASEIPTHEGDAFFNAKGTTTNGFSGDGQIYIDCQPTGQEEEILYKEDSSATKKTNMDWVYTVVKYIVGFIICIVAWKVLNKFIDFIKLIANKLSADSKSKTDSKPDFKTESKSDSKTDSSNSSTDPTMAASLGTNILPGTLPNFSVGNNQSGLDSAIGALSKLSMPNLFSKKTKASLIGI